MEHAEAQRLQRPVHALGPQQQRHQQPAADQRGHGGAHLRVAPEALPVALAQGDEIQGEVAARAEHEHQRDRLHQRRVVIAQALVVRRQPAQAHRGEHVHERFLRRHAGQPVGQRTGQREQHVDAPQALGRLGHARGELGVLHRAGRLGLEELAAAHAQQRQHGHGQDQDAHAADPLHEGAPHVHRQRQRVQARQHRGAGGGQARDGLEIRMRERHRPADGLHHHQQRQRREERDHHPHQRHQHHAVARQQLAPVLAQAYPEDGAGQAGDADRQRVLRPQPLVRPQRRGQRHAQRDGEHGQQRSEHAQDGQHIGHGGVRRRSRSRGTAAPPRAPGACGAGRTPRGRCSRSPCGCAG